MLECQIVELDFNLLAAFSSDIIHWPPFLHLVPWADLVAFLAAESINYS